jgi:hypothetical protein
MSPILRRPAPLVMGEVRSKRFSSQSQKGLAMFTYCRSSIALAGSIATTASFRSTRAGRFFLPLSTATVSGWCSLLFVGLMLSPATQAEILYNGGATTYFTNAVGSSFFVNDPVTNLFLNNTTTWAIDGAAGNNPQGRDQGWVSFQLDQLYRIDDILFEARNATGQVDGINILNVWIASTPFTVDVTNPTSTSSFKSSNPTPTFTQTGFNGALETFTLATPVIGQYFVAELINTTDLNGSRNLGAKQFVVNAVVPEPSTYAMALAGLACGGYLVRRRRKRA